MSDKAFEAFKKDNNHAMRADYIAFGVLAIIKWVKRAWQVATAAERKRIADILETRYHELSQLKTDDNSDSCWEDYNYSQKEIARLLKSLRLERK